MELKHRSIGVAAGPAADSLTNDGPGGLFLSEARGVPTEDRVGLASRRATTRDRRAGRGWRFPSLGRARPSELDRVVDHPCLDMRAKVECQPEAMLSRRLEAVDDLDLPGVGSPIAPTGGGGRAGSGSVAVVLGGPVVTSPSAVGLQFDQAGSERDGSRGRGHPTLTGPGWPTSIVLCAKVERK